MFSKAQAPETIVPIRLVRSGPVLAVPRRARRMPSRGSKVGKGVGLSAAEAADRPGPDRKDRDDSNGSSGTSNQHWLSDVLIRLVGSVGEK